MTFPRFDSPSFLPSFPIKNVDCMRERTLSVLFTVLPIPHRRVPGIYSECSKNIRERISEPDIILRY